MRLRRTNALGNSSPAWTAMCGGCPWVPVGRLQRRLQGIRCTGVVSTRISPIVARAAQVVGPEEQLLLFRETPYTNQQKLDPFGTPGSPTPTLQHAPLEADPRSHTGRRRRVGNRASLGQPSCQSILIWFVTILTFIQSILE